MACPLPERWLWATYFSVQFLTLKLWPSRQWHAELMWLPSCDELHGGGWVAAVCSNTGHFFQRTGECLSGLFLCSMLSTVTRLTELKEVLMNSRHQISGKSRCSDRSGVKPTKCSTLSWAMAHHHSWFAWSLGGWLASQLCVSLTLGFLLFLPHHLTIEELWSSRALSPGANLSEHYNTMIPRDISVRSHLSDAFVN